MILPLPFEKFIPRFYKRDSLLLAMAAKADSQIGQWFTDVKSIRYALDPVRCPANLLDELGVMLGASIAPGDTERAKRQKIYSAVKGHKNRGIFNDDLKPKIDAVTGRNDSRIIKIVGDDELVLMSENDPAAYYWASLGADGIDNNLGPFPIAENGTTTMGSVLIDLIVMQSADVIQQIRDLIEREYVPAYYIVYLGYTNGGAFTVHANGVI